jgi:hypothetical protein
MAAQEQALILRDTEGTYYVIPPAALAAGRVPADALPAVEEEVAGYIAYLPNPGSVPVLPDYGYSYSYGPNGYSYAYWYTLPRVPAPGPVWPVTPDLHAQ